VNRQDRCRRSSRYGAWFLNRLLIIDEAQRAPGLILPLKAAVDRDRRPGRFLLTGSADLLQVKGVGDSLAGRAETYEQRPLSQGELARRDTPEDFVSWLLSGPAIRDFDPLEPAVVVVGGYPEAQARSRRRAQAWFQSYASLTTVGGPWVANDGLILLCLWV
jgi:predicted AAA+ superfamily ATPase